jgi:hypothetical protein
MYLLHMILPLADAVEASEVLVQSVQPIVCTMNVSGKALIVNFRNAFTIL